MNGSTQTVEAPLEAERGNERAAAAPPQRLVLVCQLFYPELVSTGQTLTELGEELARRGVDLTVVASQPIIVRRDERIAPRIVHEGITVIRTWSTRFPKTNFLGKVVNQVTFFLTSALHVLSQESDAQLLILTNPPYLPLLGWLCHFLRGQSFGLILFDIMPEQAELLNFVRPDGWMARLWRKVNRLSYLRCAYAVVLSRDMLVGALENADVAGTPQEAECRARTHIIHVWSDDRMIEPKSKAESSEAKRLGVVNRFVVQYSGNHGRFHDIETLLEIARLLREESGIIFQFIGEGQKKNLVSRFKKQHGLENVFESSYCAKELLGESLTMSDLGVVAQMPGQERVCYPSKLLGIMAAGRPAFAICTTTCEMARMIDEQGLGFIVENGDADRGAELIRGAARDPAAVDAMGRNARRYLQDHFTLRSAAERYFDLITKPSPELAKATSYE